MFKEIRRLLELRPFKPFAVQLTNGLVLPVPTVGHAAFSPTGGHLVVFENDGTANLLSALHIARISADAEAIGSIS